MAKLLCIHKRKRKRVLSLRELIKSPECCCFRWTAYGFVLLERVLSIGIFSQRTDQIENKKNFAFVGEMWRVLLSVLGKNANRKTLVRFIGSGENTLVSESHVNFPRQLYHLVSPKRLTFKGRFLCQKCVIFSR